MGMLSNRWRCNDIEPLPECICTRGEPDPKPDCPQTAWLQRHLQCKDETCLVEKGDIPAVK